MLSASEILSLSLVASSALMASSSPSSEPVRDDPPCPELCLPQGSQGSTAGSGCAEVLFEVVGLITIGTATEGCEGTCSTCAMNVRLTIDCTDCTGPNGCTYIWENRSFDKDGNPLTTQLGTGTTTSVETTRQRLTSDCSGANAIFGVSVAAELTIYSMNCACPGGL
jgi:hypothetical protein